MYYVHYKTHMCYRKHNIQSIDQKFYKSKCYNNYGTYLIQTLLEILY